MPWPHPLTISTALVGEAAWMAAAESRIKQRSLSDHYEGRAGEQPPTGWQLERDVIPDRREERRRRDGGTRRDVVLHEPGRDEEFPSLQCGEPPLAGQGRGQLQCLQGDGGEGQRFGLRTDRGHALHDAGRRGGPPTSRKTVGIATGGWRSRNPAPTMRGTLPAATPEVTKTHLRGRRGDYHSRAPRVHRYPRSEHDPGASISV
jgi:hypothetical protein